MLIIKKIMVVIGLIIIAMFLFVLIFMPYYFTGDLDQHQTRQMEMAAVYLAERLDVGLEEIAFHGGGATGPNLFDNFYFEFSVKGKNYTVRHENTQLRAFFGDFFGLKGRMTIIETF